MGPQGRRIQLDVEFFERRVLLAANPGPLGHVTGDLLPVFQEYQSFINRGGQPNLFSSSWSGSFDFINDKILVEVRGSGDFVGLMSALKTERFDATLYSPSDKIIDGYLPLGELLDVASLTQTVSISPLWRSTPSDSMGSATNQAETTLKADLVRRFFGVDGTGVTVGVISDSANRVGNGVADSIASGDLPPAPRTQVLIDGPAGSTDEGRAMMELIYDIAPGVNLRFASGDGSEAAFATAVNTLVAAGCNIIVDDLNKLTVEPYFQDGVASQAVSNAVAQNITYFASAGNRGQSGYETPFRGANGTVAGMNGRWHNFDGGGGTDLTQTITLDTGTTQFIFQFDDPWNAATRDVDFYLLDAAGNNVLASGTDNNATTQIPREIVSFNNNTGSPLQARIAIRMVSGADITRFKYIAFNAPTITNHLNEPGAFVNPLNPGHSANANVITIAAANVDTPTTPASYTSHGPASRVFDTSGTRLANVQILNKPDLTSNDRADTSVPGFIPFGGTSAAAPNAAAIAALLRSFQTTLSPAGIRTTLINGALDIGAAGYDFVTGFGLIDAMSSFLTLTNGTLTLNGDVNGSSEDDTFRLRVDPNDATQVEITVNGSVLGAVRFAQLQQININGLGGNDTLIIDTSNGLLPIPRGIRFDGGGGFNTLQLEQTGGVTQFSEEYQIGALPGLGRDVIVGPDGTQTVEFVNLAPILAFIPATTLSITPATFPIFGIGGSILNAANAINYADAGPFLSLNTGRVTVDDAESIRFANKTNLLINAGPGSDEINLNNPVIPTGLTGNITILGSDPTASDKLIVNGTTDADTIAFSPTGTGAGSVSFGGVLPTVVFSTIEHLVLNGQGGGDTLQLTTPLGADTIAYTPGAAIDAGTFDFLSSPSFVSTTFLNLGAGGLISLLDGSDGPADTLVVNGSAASETYNVDGPNGRFTRSRPGVGSDLPVTTAGVSALVLQSVDGDDNFVVTGPLPYEGGLTIDGGNPSASDHVTLIGGAGADAIALALTAGVVTGLGGPISLLGVEHLTVDGGGGVDAFSVTGVGGLTALKTVTLIAAGASTLAFTGTAADEQFNFNSVSAGAGTLTESRQLLPIDYSGFGGGTTVNGGTGGFDTVVLNGTPGADTATSDTTTVTLNGGAVTIGDGVERLEIYTFAGDDSVVLNLGIAGLAKYIDAGDGNDTVNLSGVSADATILGGNGDDLLVGSPTGDWIDGGAGNDTLFGLGGNDTVYGGDGDDTISGGLGNDQLFGGAGSDRFFWDPGDGNDVVEGQGGQNVLVVHGTDGVADTFTFSANGTRLRADLTGGAVIDAAGIQQLNALTGSGADVVTINNLYDTQVKVINLALGAFATPDAPDGVRDSVTINGRNVANEISLTVQPVPGFPAATQVDVEGLAQHIFIRGTVGSCPAVPTDDLLTINGGIGNDRIVADRGVEDKIAMLINGNAGADYIEANATIFGGAGNDTLMGAGGPCGLLIDGGDGDDLICGNDPGNDTLIGGNGNDSIYGLGGNDTIIGGNGDDLLVGGEGVDTLTGDAGNDTLAGGAGNDLLLGGEGNDFLLGDADAPCGVTVLTTILAGQGNDTLDGGNGNDTLNGDAGNDLLFGYAGNDVIGVVSAYGIVFSEDGNDTISGGLGDDTANAGAGDDLVFGDAGNDLLLGGADNDTVSGGDGNDTLSGGDGNDTLLGDNGDDVVFGDAGTDTASGGLGNDTVSGGDGNDLVLGDDGDDVVYGDAGNDTVSGGAGNDTVSGGDGNDLITGDAGNDVISGDAGNDTISGGDGNDTVSGGAGNDTISGDNGDDVISGDDGDDSITGGNGNDLVLGGNGSDTLCGNAGNDTLSGDAGDDVVLGEAGNDLVFGGDGNDQLWGGDDNDTVVGGDGNDSIVGGAGDDLLDGGNGDDWIYGEAGNDTVFGGFGNDAIYGGEGDDWLYGGTLDTANTLHAVRPPAVPSDGDDLVSGGLGNDRVDGGNGNNLLDAGDDGIAETVLGGRGNDYAFTHHNHDIYKDFAALDGGHNRIFKDPNGAIVDPLVPAEDCARVVFPAPTLPLLHGVVIQPGRVLLPSDPNQPPVVFIPTVTDAAVKTPAKAARATKAAVKIGSTPFASKATPTSAFAKASGRSSLSPFGA